ncbi:hypothetical protein CH370_07955 [Leptospira kmetyi]|nr:hypothetical protein CH370_07955 [Leptospira kmetyi]TGL71027.1 hypothetical protein EHQ67_03940 [Leptospira kmetyi]
MNPLILSLKPFSVQASFFRLYKFFQRGLLGIMTALVQKIPASLSQLLGPEGTIEFVDYLNRAFGNVAFQCD